MSCHRVEHQNGSDPPPVFLLVSISTGIVHCLSGPTAPTRRSPTAPGLPPSPRRRGSLLGPCFNTGPSPRLLSCIFSFHPLMRPFHSSLAVLIRYRTPPVFSLRCSCHPFALHYQATLLAPRASSGALTRCGRAFHRVSCSAPQRPRAFHRGSFLFGRPYSGNPRLFLFLALVICLSPGRRPAHRAQLEPRLLPDAYRMLSRSSSSGEPIDPIQEVIYYNVSIVTEKRTEIRFSISDQNHFWSLMPLAPASMSDIESS